MVILWQCTVVVQTGDSGDEDSGLNPRWPRNFITVPRIRTVTKYKIVKLSVVTGDRTHNLHLPRLAYIPLVHPCTSHCRNKFYICMNHYCTERYIFPISKSDLWLMRNIDPDLRSGSQIRISIRITPNFELGLLMIITSLLTKFHQNPTVVYEKSC